MDCGGLRSRRRCLITNDQIPHNGTQTTRHRSIQHFTADAFCGWIDIDSKHIHSGIAGCAGRTLIRPAANASHAMPAVARQLERHRDILRRRAEQTGFSFCQAGFQAGHADGFA